MSVNDTTGLRATILAAAAAVRSLPDPIPAGGSFTDLGMDSLDRLVLADNLERATGRSIPDEILAGAHGVDDLITYLSYDDHGNQLVPAGIAPADTELGVVDDGAAIGPRSKLWHQAQIASDARLGEDCTVGKGAYIGTGSRVGDRVKIGNYACIFGATIADDAMISPLAALLEDPAPRATTPDGCRKQAADYSRRPVRVEARATVGAGALLAPGVTIGHDALVAIGAVVVRDVPAHALVAGNPARQCGWVCLCGHTLTDQMDCPTCPRTYIRIDDTITLVNAEGSDD